jgi:hypothetical protein
MLLGTFHFDDPGLDAHKPRHAFDVFSARRQSEIAEVVGLLAAYRPTKIAVERARYEQADVDDAYRAHVRGGAPLAADEVHQLGFRLAARLGHARVWCVNAWDRYYEPPVDCEPYLRAGDRATPERLLGGAAEELARYARERGQAHLLSEWSDYFRATAARWDELKSQRRLREHLRDANAEANLLRAHGAYLVGRFKLSRDGDYAGADWTTAWFNRNLRIFANLQRITAPGDRLLLVIGAGHVPILRHCALASPEYDLAEVADYL